MADLNLRPMVRSVAVEVAQADPLYAHQVRETTDTLVCALLQLAPPQGARLQCLFRLLDGEVRVRASLADPPEVAPEDKARAASLLDQLVVHVNTFTTTASEDQGSELVYEAVVVRPQGTPPAR